PRLAPCPVRPLVLSGPLPPLPFRPGEGEGTANRGWHPGPAQPPGRGRGRPFSPALPPGRPPHIPPPPGRGNGGRTAGGGEGGGRSEEHTAELQSRAK